ncbi:MAG: ATP-dependent RecD-like DNA helicase [Eubacterium sp.]
MTISGYVEKILFKNEDTGYMVIVIADGDKEKTCTGRFAYLEEGEYIEVSGEEIMHPIYGKQISMTSYEIKHSTDAISIQKYIGSGAIKGVGEALAKRIVDKFGEDTFHIIEQEPERLSEVKGISERKAREISAQVMEKRDVREAMIFLQNYGISAGLAVKVYNEYGEDIYNIIKTNPYRIADDIAGVGFRRADDIAKRVGIADNSDFRIKSGIIYTLNQAANAGHTYLPKELLIKQVSHLLEIEDIVFDKEGQFNIEALDNLINDLALESKIVIKEIDGILCIYSSLYYYTELDTARMLHDLNVRTAFGDERLLDIIKDIEEKEDMQLDELQRLAVMEAVNNGLLVITGGPGTGKTTTINVLIRLFEAASMSISLAAPTGRAAKRMTEATGYEAQTIHRLLELSGAPSENRAIANFERNERRPLESDIIIIDEMSMVDLFLMHSLLKAIMPGTRLILVGDVDQLPSVGPGSVLRDIIKSNCFNVVMLVRIFRQAGESDIVVNAHKINKGEQVLLDNNSKDFLYIKGSSIESTLNSTVALVKDKLPGYVNASSMDIQVLTPMRKGEMGVEGLNQRLQASLNPKSDTKYEINRDGCVFREGDKVMQIKNNYQLEWERRTKKGLAVDYGMGIFNGDTGVITRINLTTKMMEVEFDEHRYVVYSFNQLDELELAYAVTIHKSQGSEYPAVVIPLLGGPKMLMNRNLLYTGITRAKTCVCIVGSAATFREMIENEKQYRRYSGLKNQIETYYKED